MGWYLGLDLRLGFSTDARGQVWCVGVWGLCIVVVACHGPWNGIQCVVADGIWLQACKYGHHSAHNHYHPTLIVHLHYQLPPQKTTSQLVITTPNATARVVASHDVCGKSIVHFVTNELWLPPPLWGANGSGA